MSLLTRTGPAALGWIALLFVDNLAAAAPLRIIAVSAFLLLCPGLALLRPLRPALRGSQPLEGPAEEAGGDGRGAVAAQNLLLVVMLSLSALVAASTALMLAGAFSGSGTLVVLAALTSVATLCPALRAGRRPGTPSGTPPAAGG